MISCLYCHTEYGKRGGCVRCDTEVLLTTLQTEVEGLIVYKVFDDRGSDAEFIHKGDVLAIINKLRGEA